MNAASVKDKARELGFSFVGIAAIEGLRDRFLLAEHLRERFGRAVVLGKRLLGPVLDDIVDRPTPIYFHHYRQLNHFLDREAFRLASWIQDGGGAALPVPASQILDWENQRAHAPHKEMGRLAGLGWIGRSNLLVHPEFGARFRLVSVLTDLPLEADGPLDRDCGTCFACLEPCPAGAIKERREDFDHRACYAKLEEFRRSRVTSQHICGVCVKACRGTAG